MWKVEDVPWDFSNPEGQLFETSLRREDVGEDMWSKFTKGQAFIHLLGCDTLSSGLPQRVCLTLNYVLP